jgi:trans-2,3-dihydro-3-hydroxyanthranilate isomerase
MRYLHLDVFTTTPFEGNQLAVFPEPSRGLTTETMQRVAAEMAFSESTFLFPREASGDIRLRIFTPGDELPMAGHPTIGTTFALAAEGVIERGRREFVFECGVGPIPVSLEWDDRGLSFAWMTQLAPTFGRPIEDRDGIAAAMGLEREDVVDGLPVQPVSCGVPFMFVALATRRAVDRVTIDRRAFGAVLRSAGEPELPVFFFSAERTPDAGDETVYSRMIAPAFGIAEDPATGGASGPLGCYLLHHRVVTSAQAGAMQSLQGVAMRRPSRIHISIEERSGTITRVRVGGTSVIVGRGELDV